MTTVTAHNEDLEPFHPLSNKDMEESRNDEFERRIDPKKSKHSKSRATGNLQ